MFLAPFYATGTISVSNGSSTVTGSGTSFLAAGIRQWDKLIIAGRMAIIESVNSATSLTLLAPWPEGSVSSVPTLIERVNDPQRSLNAATNFLAVVNEGPMQGRFGNGSAAAPGVSFADETSMGMYRIAAGILGLSVDGLERLRAGVFGVDVSNALMVDGSEVYRRANVLGDVGHSGGVPNGGLMEYGSGPNGAYVRLVGGLQICTRTVTIPAGTQGGTGFDFPAGFLNAASVLGVALGGANGPDRPTSGGGYASRYRSAIQTVVGSNSASAWEVAVRNDDFDIGTTADFTARLFAIGLYA